MEKGSKTLNDGLLVGNVSPTQRRCDQCGQGKQITVSISAMTFPEYVEPGDKRIIARVGRSLGITCGCYASFHRQMAYIKAKHKTKEKS